jgi:hypothetical protein
MVQRVDNVVAIRWTVHILRVASLELGHRLPRLEQLL